MKRAVSVLHRRLVSSLGSIPLLLGSGAILGWWIGRWLDRRFGTAPWMQVVFLGLGIAGSVRSSLRFAGAQRDLDRM
ncbi:MAG: AtpZ/AtpI family protein [Candidatus Eisenbacteria bacterium]